MHDGLFSIDEHRRRRWARRGTTARTRNERVLAAIRAHVTSFKLRFCEQTQTEARRVLTELLRVIRANRQTMISHYTLGIALEVLGEWIESNRTRVRIVRAWATPIANDPSAGIGRTFATALLAIAARISPLQRTLFD